MTMLADTLVFVHCAHTSLRVLEEFGTLGRERVFCSRLFRRFGRVVVVSYGGPADMELVRTLAPELGGAVAGVCNDRGEEPGVFLAGVPDRVRRSLGGSKTALVLTDQHYGGDVGVCTARVLREAGLRTGLVARGGYHWAWFVAREEGADSRAYALARHLESELVHAADVVVGTTQRMLDDLAMLHGAGSDRFRLVPNFVLADEPPPAHEHREPGLILSAGRLHPQKRFDRLLEAVATMSAAVRERSRLLILGSGPEEARLRGLIARSGINAEIHGRVPHRELLSLMRRCAVYVQCAEYEGHPKTIVEAMAGGCPTVVTEGPGVSDSVRHGVTGLVVPHSPAAIGAALEQLLTDPAEASRLGIAAAEATRAALGIDVVFPLYLQACVDAMKLAGDGRRMPPPVVRWDPPMLRLGPEAGAEEWGSSLAAFAKRLEPGAREAFWSALSGRVSGWEEGVEARVAGHTAG